MSGHRQRWWTRRTRPGFAPSPSPQPATAAPLAPPDPREREAEVLSRLHDYVYVQVRSGVFDLDELRRITVEAATAEVGEATYADLLARRVLSAELTDWYAEAGTWRARTDPDRLDAALATLGADGVLILPAIASTTQIASEQRVRGRSGGTIAYTVGDIWNALDHGELPLTVLDGAGAPATRTSGLVVALMDALAAQGLLGYALGTPGAVVVPLHWRRRPTVPDESPADEPPDEPPPDDA